MGKVSPGENSQLPPLAMFEHRLGQLFEPELLDQVRQALSAVGGLSEEDSNRDDPTITDPSPTKYQQGFWCNPLKWQHAPRELANIAPFQGLGFEVLENCALSEGAERNALMSHPWITEGVLYPINLSSALPIQVLNPRLDEEILDLAAAPGGKTLMIAGAMANGGRVAAVEAVKPRFHRMRSNLARCGVSNVETYLADGRSIGRKVPERFDGVLLDAPCSSEARIRLNQPQSYAHWSLRKVRECARKQKGLLRSAYTALKPGGRLVYCTCSFAPEENEAVVNHLLVKEPKAELLPIRLPDCVPLLPGKVSWGRRSYSAQLHHARRVIPSADYDGFFICCIRKASS